MFNRECITTHPSQRSLTIHKIHPLTEQTSFTVKGNAISIKGEDSSLTIVAKNDIEQKNFTCALERAISSLLDNGGASATGSLAISDDDV
jgi:hypothetical protein